MGIESDLPRPPPAGLPALVCMGTRPGGERPRSLPNLNQLPVTCIRVRLGVRVSVAADSPAFDAAAARLSVRRALRLSVRPGPRRAGAGPGARHWATLATRISGNGKTRGGGPPISLNRLARSLRYKACVTHGGSDSGTRHWKQIYKLTVTQVT